MWIGEKVAIKPLLNLKYQDMVVGLVDGISTPYGLFNAEIWLISKCLIIIEEREKEKKSRERFYLTWFSCLILSTSYVLLNVKNWWLEQCTFILSFFFFFFFFWDEIRAPSSTKKEIKGITKCLTWCHK